MNTLSPNHCIERLKCLYGEQDCQSKLLNMKREMPNDVEFQFVEPVWCPTCGTLEEVLNGLLKLLLNKVLVPLIPELNSY